jgi:hypothetical protein
LSDFCPGLLAAYVPLLFDEDQLLLPLSTEKELSGKEVFVVVCKISELIIKLCT